MNIEEDVRLDKADLAGEDSRFAAIYYYYAKELAKAKTNLDAAKTNLDASEARRELFYRKTPLEGLKITEAVIIALTADDTEVQQHKIAVDKAQAEVNLLYAAVMSMNEKSSRLKELVSLNNRDYYNSGTPTDSMHDRLR